MGHLPGATNRPSTAAGRPSPPPPPPYRFPPQASRQSACSPRVHTRPSHLLPGCLRPQRPGRLHASPRITPDPLAHFLVLIPSLSLCTSCPSATIATDAVRRGHRQPLALPLSSGAPPRPPLPPHQGGRRRKPWLPPAPPFPSSATEDSRHRFAAIDASPELLTCSPTPL